mmetsp:Transcript_29538/g.95318  ORF Transcript_29538/g.95318 Transcript_29538/m.95318 type:complete len:210 (-) Transcript_29538:542-1171(-)
MRYARHMSWSAAMFVIWNARSRRRSGHRCRSINRCRRATTTRIPSCSSFSLAPCTAYSRGSASARHKRCSRVIIVKYFQANKSPYPQGRVFAMQPPQRSGQTTPAVAILVCRAPTCPRFCLEAHSRFHLISAPIMCASSTFPTRTMECGTPTSSSLAYSGRGATLSLTNSQRIVRAAFFSTHSPGCRPNGSTLISPRGCGHWTLSSTGQ